LRSALYRGAVSHHRGGEVKNRFAYPLYVACFDVDELARLDRQLRLFCLEGPGVFSLRGADYPLAEVTTRPSRRPPPRADLATRARAALAAAAPETVLLITQPRVFGHGFNPVSFFVGLRGGDVAAVIAEVNNTYDQSYAYRLDDGNRIEGKDGVATFRTPKSFFVSPFIADDVEYEWAFAAPGERLEIRVTATAGGERFFAARLSGERRPLSDRELLAALLRWPALPAQILARIHWQALRLRRRGVPYRRPAP
jgi:hypothetical protein